MKLFTVMTMIAVRLTTIFSGTALGTVTDFSEWTQVQDPAHPLFTGSSTTTDATLVAGDGGVPIGTDIGYQSVDGATPAASTAGYAFDPSSDFMVAIDYSASFSNSPTGSLLIGFGIGEDAEGMNSAGAGLLTSNGAPFGTFAGSARINDVNQTALITLLPSTLSGSLFASYDAATGDVGFGAAQVQGAAAPAAGGTYTGIQNQWAGGDLLASFFIRSDLGGWQGGHAEVTFSNFRVLEGAPKIVPEPASLMLLGLGGFALRRRRQRLG